MMRKVWLAGAGWLGEPTRTAWPGKGRPTVPARRGPWSGLVVSIPVSVMP